MTRELRKLSVIPVVAVALLAGACSTSKLSVVPTGAPAYAIVPPPDRNKPSTSSVIIPNDILNLQVFQEPDLSNARLRVDSGGNIQMPLLGEVRAAGRTAPQLGAEISRRLGERYIVNPQVVVSISEPAPRRVAVEGQVNKPGVYDIDSEDTLLSTIARAESPTEVAKLNEVVVFRTLEGKRMAARFNLEDVRAGLAPDPEILGGDVVVVGFSGLRGAWRDLLRAAPLFNVFTRY